MRRIFSPLAALLVAGVALSAEDPESLARRLAELRAEVEQLHADLDAEREGIRNAARAHETAKADLEASVREKVLEAEEVSRTLARMREEAAQSSAAHEAMRPVVDHAVARLTEVVQGGLPFRQEERLTALRQIQEGVAAGAIDPRVAVTRLWQHVEDELRLARENTLDRVTIEVEGSKRHVQVARLGMVAMFYQAEDLSVGKLVQRGGAWTWESIEGEEAVEQVHHLFEAFDKQGRTGWYEIPWALPAVTP